MEDGYPFAGGLVEDAISPSNWTFFADCLNNCARRRYAVRVAGELAA